jgi:hypothetical protein
LISEKPTYLLSGFFWYSAGMIKIRKQKRLHLSAIDIEATFYGITFMLAIIGFLASVANVVFGSS